MERRRVLAIDTETNAKGLYGDPEFRVLGVSYASGDSRCGYLPIGHITTSEASKALALQKLRRIVEQHSIYVFHNGKYDLPGLHFLGIDLWDADWYDTMLMQHFIDENSPNKSLDYMGKTLLDEGKEKDKEFVRFVDSFGWAFLPVWMTEPYAIQDAKLTRDLFFHLLPEFEKQGFL